MFGLGDEVASWKDRIPLDPDLTPEERARVDRLTEAEVARIDAGLMRQVSPHWQKVAKIVGNAMSELAPDIPSVIDLFYAERVRHLVERNELEAQGDVRRMRFSEVRRPAGA